MEKREYIRHQMSITMDLDNVSEGIPSHQVNASTAFQHQTPAEDSLEFEKKGVTQRVGEIVVGGHT
jgi:hypothetical protein